MINKKTKIKSRRVATFNGDKVVWHATLKNNKSNVSVIDVLPGRILGQGNFWRLKWTLDSPLEGSLWTFKEKDRLLFLEKKYKQTQTQKNKQIIKYDCSDNFHLGLAFILTV